MIDRYKETYDKRWEKSINTDDDDILVIDNPKTQVEFFYNEYNKIIESKIKSFFIDRSAKDLLEVGCGRATASIYLSKKLGLNISVSDYSEAALEVAKKNMNKYNVKGESFKADLYELPFSDNSYDVVISLGVMEHIDDPYIAYKEMKRVLRPDGLMISMNVPENSDNIQRVAITVNSFLSKMERFFSHKVSKPWLDRTQSKTDNVYRSTWSGSDFKEAALHAGFESVQVMECNVFPTFSPVFKFIDRAIVSIYIFILKFRRLQNERKNPFECSKNNSRVHFIFAKSGPSL
jgi:ubiquinone/menaquinone biosynthesis C-methylase UbiE